MLCACALFSQFFHGRSTLCIEWPRFQLTAVNLVKYWRFRWHSYFRRWSCETWSRFCLVWEKTRGDAKGSCFPAPLHFSSLCGPRCSRYRSIFGRQYVDAGVQWDIPFESAQLDVWVLCFPDRLPYSVDCDFSWGIHQCRECIASCV